MNSNTAIALFVCLTLTGCKTSLEANRSHQEARASTEARTQTEQQAQSLANADMRKLYVKANPELDERIKAAIEQGAVVVGMTKTDVFWAWGVADHENIVSQGVGGSLEQWVYKRTYVYFRDGKVVSWQRF